MTAWGYTMVVPRDPGAYRRAVIHRRYPVDPRDWLRENRGKRFKRRNGALVYTPHGVKHVHFGWRRFTNVVCSTNDGRVDVNVPYGDIIKMEEVK